MASPPPRYLILAGVVFDDILGAPEPTQLLFLRLLCMLRRDPRTSEVLDIEPYRLWGEGFFMAALEGLDVSYQVVDDEFPRVVLISALWV